MSRTGPVVSLFAIALASVTAATAAGDAGAQTPGFRDVVGHDFGERITQHHQMVRYLERLAEASPRVAIIDQGVSWEGRSLILAIVTAPENHARLDRIRETAQRLGDPRSTAPDEATTLMAGQPAVVWFGGSIHGFELSGSEGLLKLLEHLTTRDDAATRAMLDSLVVLIDPMLNPDGRDAFAHLNHENIGSTPSPERDDWSNDFTAWQALKFRTGHYYFDTNRDWFAHTQRETRARVGTLTEWRPQVVVDAHEMGPNVEFYFDPAGEPYGPLFPEFAYRWLERFGQAYAQAFDSAGFEYMTRERYNYFYPGYTTSYGSYQGGVGMLYEQGSSRGLALTRADGSVRTLADALEQQYVAALAAVRLAARERTRLLREQYEAHRAAIADGGRGIRRYLLPPEGDPQRVAGLAALLMRGGVDVGVLSEAARLDAVRDRTGREVGDREFPAGTYVVEAAQPRNRLIRALLDPEVPLPDDFMAAARARVDRAENPRFYDITTWSLPLLFDIGGYGTPDGRTLPAEPLDEPPADALDPAGPAAATSGTHARGSGGTRFPVNAPGTAAYAYVLEGDRAGVMGALHEARARGYRAAVLLRPSRIGDRDIPGGSVILRVGQNDSTLHDFAREITEDRKLATHALDSGLSEPGFPALGSGDHVVPVREPEIALLAEDPIHPYSFGWAWYTLDRQYAIPVTVLRTRSIAETRIDRFNVLVIPDVIGGSPDAAMRRALGDSGVARLSRWVRDGGTLVTIGSATEAARGALDLIELPSWYETDDGKEAQRFDVPGAVLRATLDTLHWLSAGYTDPELPALATSSAIYLAPDGPPSSRRRVAAAYAAEGPLRLSGHAWPESLERLPGGVLVYEERVGSGRVIAFAEDPNFRAYWRGANRLFLNAVVLGPSAP